MNMPKRKKGSRKVKDITEFGNLANLTGFDDGVGSVLDDCMAEMMSHGQRQKEPQPNSYASVANTAPLDDRRIHDQNDRNVSRTVIENAQVPSWIQQAKNPHNMSKTMISEEHIQTWNQNFEIWINGGIYTPGLLPNIDQEIVRNFKVKELSSLLLKNEHVAGRDLRMPVFERWLLDSKNEEVARGLIGDSVLPIRSSLDSEASRRLLSELISTKIGVDRKNAENIIAKLCRKTNLVSQELFSQDDRYRRQSPLKNGDRLNVLMELTSRNRFVIVEYSRKRWKKPFCFKINHRHYIKLKDRFIETHPNFNFTDNDTMNTNVEAKIRRSFHILVVALQLRYSALSGGGLLDDLRGGGMQGAIHSCVFEVLQSHFSNAIGNTSSTEKNFHRFWFEGFASPFNATLPHFASAFPFLDWHFGSVGRFLDCRFDGDVEYCEANPPFSPGIMFSMADHMFKALKRADKKGSCLTFIVIVPSVDILSKRDSMSSHLHKTAFAKHAAEKSFQRMTYSDYCVKHIRLSAREHGYVEGAQHLRPTQFKQSSYDSSVIILQSPAACGTDLQELEKNIRVAFSSRHKIELAKRKREAVSSIVT
mmetsp:Transcript_19579/g.45635  ORF Transcript_19579/g.45635 Transcript_19579/m.45635 type:complete len:591 (+) Transcript_19579:57-1829(+)